MNKQLDTGKIEVGTRVTTQVYAPTTVQLFRFSAATSNPHRIHYDTEYAQSEGYPDILVQSHLHASLICKTLLEWAGPNARLKRFRWENRTFAVPGEQLIISGAIAAVRHESLQIEVDVKLEETKQDGTVSVPAWATLVLEEKF